MHAFTLLGTLALLSLSLAAPSSHLLPRRHSDRAPAADIVALKTFDTLQPPPALGNVYHVMSLPDESRRDQQVRALDALQAAEEIKDAIKVHLQDAREPREAQPMKLRAGIKRSRGGKGRSRRGC